MLQIVLQAKKKIYYNQMTKIKMIVGLGNPGKKYENHRHNVGEWFIAKIAKYKNQLFNSNSNLNSNIAKISIAHNNIAHNNITLVFPTTYMNNSGLAVVKIADLYKIQPDEILVVHDDLDIISGDIKFKNGGGHGGHNGLKSIHQNLNTDNYLRLRIGIGHPGHKLKVPKYVLSDPSIDQKKKINQSIDDVIYFLDSIFKFNL